MLERAFYLTNGVELAKALIGKVLVHETPEGVLKGRIVETEAYMGASDAAAHSYKGNPFGRVNVQYGAGGFAYIYLIYGMHSCMNVVANLEGVPEAVLIRALEPVFGIEQMQKNRGTEALKALCSGPGKLCSAMKIDRALYGADLCQSPFYLEEAEEKRSFRIGVTARINVDYAGEASKYPWRFVELDSPYLSKKPKPHELLDILDTVEP
ncbi:MAG TPA: DNA-3-methyladenine glycosylase [Clostridia bacterium]|nr:DNA-3-methyladenine glycosylase [Clostridia bacterium]